MRDSFSFSKHSTDWEWGKVFSSVLFCVFRNEKTANEEASEREKSEKNNKHSKADKTKLKLYKRISIIFQLKIMFREAPWRITSFSVCSFFRYKKERAVVFEVKGNSHIETIASCVN